MANQQSRCSSSSSSSSRVANGASIIPLSKTKTGLNSSTNTTAISCRMKYSQNINTYGITKPSISAAKKTCSLGGPTFSY